MSFKRKLLLLLVLGLFLTGLFYIKSVFADWRSDVDPPVTTITASGTGCYEDPLGGNIIKCPNTTTVNITVSCTDLISGCQIMHSSKNASYSPDYPQTVPPNSYAPFTVSIADGNPVTVYAYSVDNAGNSEATNQKTKIINFEYSISGTVFLDQTPPSKTNNADPADPEYNGAIHIKAVNTSTGLTEKECLPSVCTSGAYSLTLPAGTYRISYENFPGGYTQIEPPAGSPPPAFTVIVGSGCDVSNPSPPPSPYSVNASCTASNNIEKLDFGMVQTTSSTPWFQCIGADCRVDDDDGSGGEPPSGPPTGFKDVVPSDGSPPAYCADDPDYPANYASIPNDASGTSNDPGIIFSAGPFDFGLGKASDDNWQIKNTRFKPVRPNVIRTSYDYYMSVVEQNDISTTNLASPAICPILSNCTLPAGLANGVYTATGNVTLNSYTFTGNKDYVFLINGDLNINGNIRVDSGSTATFSVSNDIIVDALVGGTATTPCNVTTHTGCHIEGYYSADRHFTIEASSLRLNVAGAIVIDADKTDGVVGIIRYEDRNLGSNNEKCPSFTITERPDFILNAPEFLKHATFTWQEIAP